MKKEDFKQLIPYELAVSLYSSLAQSVEHLTVNQGVAGSSPAGGAKKARGTRCVPLAF